MTLVTFRFAPVNNTLGDKIYSSTTTSLVDAILNQGNSDCWMNKYIPKWRTLWVLINGCNLMNPFKECLMVDLYILFVTHAPEFAFDFPRFWFRNLVKFILHLFMGVVINRFGSSLDWFSFDTFCRISPTKYCGHVGSKLFFRIFSAALV